MSVKYEYITLISDNNPKTSKGNNFKDEKGVFYSNHIVYLAPYTLNGLGKNLCANASDGCAKACLNLSGNGGKLPSVKNARVKRARNFIVDPIKFVKQLIAEITILKLQHDDKNLVIRLNGTSDLPFENIKINGLNIFEYHNDIIFYDYTKNIKRLRTKLPSNYHLTFSRSETNDKECNEALKLGFNVAMVFYNELPKTYKGYNVINGDIHDMRFLDNKDNNEPKIIGLKYKRLTFKNAKATNKENLESGFVITDF